MKIATSRRMQVAGGVALAIGIAGLTAANLAAQRPPAAETVAAGRVLFEHEWTPHDPLSKGGDGLGPVFNAKSCAECHFQGGLGGGGTNKHNVLSFEVHPTPANPQPHGGVVHQFAIDDAFREDRDSVAECFPVVKGGVRVQSGCTTTFEDFDPVRYEGINTPPLFGLALIENISDGAIRRSAQFRGLALIGKEFQHEFDGTPTGRARVLEDGSVGKFGWKGQFASVEDFVATACAVEMGLTNPLRAQGEPRKYQDDADAKYDMNREQLYELVSFVRTLPRPVEVLPSDASEQARVEHGRELFSTVGCADCHTPDLGGVQGLYSDLMLHQIEDPETDPSYVQIDTEVPLPDAHPRAAEWKTPPLWGVADSAPYLHDGSAPTLSDAIERHAGEADAVTGRYRRLDEVDQAALLAFLKTLRAPQTAPGKTLASR